jgi:hypothetical protein
MTGRCAGDALLRERVERAGQANRMGEACLIHDVIDGVAYPENSRVEGSQNWPASGVAGLFSDGQTGAGAVVSEKVDVLGRAGARLEPASGLRYRSPSLRARVRQSKAALARRPLHHASPGCAWTAVMGQQLG